MTTVRNEDTSSTLSPNTIMEHYCRAYKMVHGNQPHITHISAEWYEVNGETVHRITLFGEITRLRGLAQQQRLAKTDKSLVQRLIARLRGV
jgi:hypothetical protein